MNAVLLSFALVVVRASTPTLDVVEPVIAGQANSMTLTRDGAALARVEVVAKYRQNAHAAIQHEQKIGATNAEGRLSWVPDQAGVVVLAFDGGSHNVAVRHRGVPISGVLIALLAGLLLVGGSAFMLVRMLRQHDDPS